MTRSKSQGKSKSMSEAQCPGGGESSSANGPSVGDARQPAAVDEASKGGKDNKKERKNGNNDDKGQGQQSVNVEDGRGASSGSSSGPAPRQVETPSVSKNAVAGPSKGKSKCKDDADGAALENAGGSRSEKQDARLPRETEKPTGKMNRSATSSTSGLEAANAAKADAGRRGKTRFDPAESPAVAPARPIVECPNRPKSLDALLRISQDMAAVRVRVTFGYQGLCEWEIAHQSPGGVRTTSDEDEDRSLVWRPVVCRAGQGHAALTMRRPSAAATLLNTFHGIRAKRVRGTWASSALCDWEIGVCGEEPDAPLLWLTHGDAIARRETEREARERRLLLWRRAPRRLGRKVPMNLEGVTEVEMELLAMSDENWERYWAAAEAKTAAEEAARAAQPAHEDGSSETPAKSVSDTADAAPEQDDGSVPDSKLSDEDPRAQERASRKAAKRWAREQLELEGLESNGRSKKLSCAAQEEQQRHWREAELVADAALEQPHDLRDGYAVIEYAQRYLKVSPPPSPRGDGPMLAPEEEAPRLSTSARPALIQEEDPAPTSQPEEASTSTLDEASAPALSESTPATPTAPDEEPTAPAAALDETPDAAVMEGHATLPILSDEESTGSRQETCSSLPMSILDAHTGTSSMLWQLPPSLRPRGEVGTFVEDEGQGQQQRQHHVQHKTQDEEEGHGKHEHEAPRHAETQALADGAESPLLPTSSNPTHAEQPPTPAAHVPHLSFALSHECYVQVAVDCGLMLLLMWVAA